MIRYVETKHALLIFAVPGFVLFVFGLGLGLFVLESYRQTHVPALGLAMVTVLVTVVGLLLAFTGLIMHAVITANERHH
jgi:prolipoprotein diacylglyceryltransferase